MPALRSVQFPLDVLNMDGDTLAGIGHRLDDGQVDVVAKSEGPTRSMSVKLYDPDHRLRLDSDAPQAGSLAADRMLRAWSGVKVPEVGWVNVPVFTGPIVKISRNGVLLEVECQGRESRALKPVWRTFTVPKGTRKTDAIRRIMREVVGITDFDIPDLPTRLGSSASLTPEAPEKRRKFNSNTPWGLCQQIARSMGRQLFFDGWGRLRLRRLPGSPVFTFDHSLIQSEDGPSVVFDLERSKNAIRVVGKTLHEGKEKKGTAQIPTHVVSGEAVARPDHPLSPQRLGTHLRDGTLVPFFNPDIVTNDAVRSDKEATNLARQILHDRLMQAVDISFDALPVPHLEEMDLVRVKYDDLNIRIRLERFTLPLTHAGVMSVGDVKLVERPRVR